MDEAKTTRLHQLLRRLGQAVHGSVVHSDDVKECLQELHESGWRAVMLVETSVACDEHGAVEPTTGTLRLHVDETADEAKYRIGVNDARLLSSLGIAPGRHRAHGAGSRRAPAEKEADGDH
jgi:hypothetical protein